MEKRAKKGEDSPRFVHPLAFPRDETPYAVGNGDWTQKAITLLA